MERGDHEHIRIPLDHHVRVIGEPDRAVRRRLAIAVLEHLVVPRLVRRRARRAEALVHADRLHAIPVAELPMQVVARDEMPEPGMERTHVVILEIDLDEGLPVEGIFDGLDLVEPVVGEVELPRDAETGEVARDITLAVEQHAVPLLQRLPRQVEARMVGELGCAKVGAVARVAPAMQRAGDGAAGKRARALQHDRLAMAAHVGDEIVAPGVVHEGPRALRAPVEHAIAARLARHLLVRDIPGALGEKELLLHGRHLRVEIPRKRQVKRRAREQSLTREIRHYPHPQYKRSENNMRANRVS